MNRLIIACSFLLCLSAFAGGPFERNNGGGPVSQDTTQTFLFHVESGNLNNLYDNAEITAFINSEFEDWDAVPGSQLRIAPGEKIMEDINTAAQVTAALNAGLSPIVLDEDGTVFEEMGFGGLVLAFAGPRGVNAAGTHRTQMMAVIGGPANNGRSEAEVRGTLLHEFGHGLGLAHSVVNADPGVSHPFGAVPIIAFEIMFWQARAAVHALHTDDISGYLALYGDTPQGTSGMGAISGTIYLPNGDPADGVNVIARDHSGERSTYFANAAAMITTPITGEYTIVGLPPGEYSIQVYDIALRNAGSYGSDDPLRTDNAGYSRNRIGAFPGPEEYYNGASESNSSNSDDPADFILVTVSADQTVSGIDIHFNRAEGVQGTSMEKVYYVPEVQAANDSDTRIGIVNLSDSNSASLDVYAFASSGAELGRANNVPPIAPNGKAWISIQGAFPELAASVAWVQVGSNQDLNVFAEIAGDRTRSAYWASDTLETVAYMPHVAKNTATFATYLSSVNGGPNNVDTTLTTQPGGAPVNLPEHAQGYAKSANDVRDLFGDDLSAIDWVRLNSSGGGTPVGSASMEYFTVLPDQTQMASLGLTSQTGNTLRFLHVAADVNQFWTGLVYMNVGTGTAAVTETYYDANGAVLEARNKQLAAGAKVNPIPLFDQSNNDPAGTVWMTVTSNQPLVGYELFGAPSTSGHDYFAGLQGNYTEGVGVIYPHVVSSANEFTGLVAVNVGDETADVSFTAYSAAGTALETATVSGVAPNVKVTRLVRDLFSADNVPNTAWVRATGSGSDWAGFQLWGDISGPRQHLAGINGSIVGSLPPAPDGVTVVEENDDNNTYETAQVITMTGNHWNTNVIGFMDQLEAGTPISAGGDNIEDIYKFTLETATPLLIAVAPDNTNADLDLFVVREGTAITNALFTDPFNTNPNFDFSASSTGDEAVMHTFAPGTYYILVSSWDDTGNTLREHEYGLLVSSNPLVLETFDDPDSVEFTTGVLTSDTDGSTTWTLSDGVQGTIYNLCLASFPPEDGGTEAAIVRSPTFTVPDGGVTLMDTDFGLIYNSGAETGTEIGFGVVREPASTYGTLVYTNEPTTNPVTYLGTSLVMSGWNRWLGLGRPYDEVVYPPGTTDAGIALVASHPHGYVIFDNTRAYNLFTSKSPAGTNRKVGASFRKRGIDYAAKTGLKQTPAVGWHGEAVIKPTIVKPLGLIK